MAYEAIEITQATAQQRLDFARKVLNLDLDEVASDEQVISAIRSAQPQNDKIFVEMDAAPSAQDQAQTEGVDPEPPTSGSRLSGSRGRGDPMATIMIPKSEGPMGSDDVAVMVNGVGWQLQRGVDLTVPWRVVVALGYTEQDLITHSDEGNVITNKSLRFPFQFKDMPDKAVIQDWFERTKNAFCP